MCLFMNRILAKRCGILIGGSFLFSFLNLNVILMPFSCYFVGCAEGKNSTRWNWNERFVIRFFSLSSRVLRWIRLSVYFRRLKIWRDDIHWSLLNLSILFTFVPFCSKFFLLRFISLYLFLFWFCLEFIEHHDWLQKKKHFSDSIL